MGGDYHLVTGQRALRVPLGDNPQRASVCDVDRTLTQTGAVYIVTESTLSAYSTCLLGSSVALASLSSDFIFQGFENVFKFPNLPLKS